MSDDSGGWARVRRRGAAMLLVLTAAYFFVYFHRMSLNAVGAEMVGEVGGGTKEVLSSVYFWTYAAMQIPSGLLADRLGPRRASAAFLAMAAAGSVLTCAADGFAALAAGKALIAAGMAVVYIPLMKVISVWFARDDFPLLNGIVIAVGNVGALAAAAPLAILSDAVGWRNVFLVLGLVSMALSALCFAVVRDHPRDAGLPAVEELGRGDEGDRSDAKAPALAGLRAVFGSGRVFWTLGPAYFLLYGTVMVFQGTVCIEYFRSHVYCFAAAAWFATAIGVSKIAGTVLAGRLASRRAAPKRALMTLGTFAYMLVWAAIWLLAGEVQSGAFWLGVCVVFGFSAGFMTLSFSQVKEWFPISISGTAMSAMNSMLFLGAAAATTAAGAVLHGEYTVGNYSALWGLMFAAAAAAFLLTAASKERGENDALIAPEGAERGRRLYPRRSARMPMAFRYARLEESVVSAVRDACEGREVAVAFSGGLDSGLVAALAGRFAESATLYTCGADGSSDVAASEALASELGMEWVRLPISKGDIEGHIRGLISASDASDPFTVSYELPFYRVCSSCREGTVLTGQGADELFMGCAKYVGLSDAGFAELRDAGVRRLLEVSVPCERRIAERFSKTVAHPYLDPRVGAALSELDPMSLKPADMGSRKAALREVAVHLGFGAAAGRAKKSSQYGSGASDLVRSMARSRGMRYNEYVAWLYDEAIGGSAPEGRGAVVYARIDPAAKADAERVLRERGVSPSRAVEMLYRRIAEDGDLRSVLPRSRRQGVTPGPGRSLR